MVVKGQVPEKTHNTCAMSVPAAVAAGSMFGCNQLGDKQPRTQPLPQLVLTLTNARSINLYASAERSTPSEPGAKCQDHYRHTRPQPLIPHSLPQGQKRRSATGITKAIDVGYDSILWQGQLLAKRLQQISVRLMRNDQINLLQSDIVSFGDFNCGF